MKIKANKRKEAGALISLGDRLMVAEMLERKEISPKDAQAKLGCCKSYISQMMKPDNLAKLKRKASLGLDLKLTKAHLPKFPVMEEELNKWIIEMSKHVPRRCSLCTPAEDMLDIVHCVHCTMPSAPSLAARRTTQTLDSYRRVVEAHPYVAHGRNQPGMHPPVTTNAMQEKALEIATQLQVVDFKASNTWFMNFIKRYAPVRTGHAASLAPYESDTPCLRRNPSLSSESSAFALHRRFRWCAFPLSGVSYPAGAAAPTPPHPPLLRTNRTRRVLHPVQVRSRAPRVPH